MWCNLHHAAKLRPYWLSAIRSRRSSFLRSGMWCASNPRHAWLSAVSHAVWYVRHVCAISKEWCVLDQHEIYAANTVDDGATAGTRIRQLPSSTTATTNEEHRVIADDWLRRAIDGIRVMHLNDDERRRVAERLF
jgi:hypothetical protein